MMPASSYFLGIDIGSLSCDAVVVDSSGRICSAAVVPTGARNTESISRVTSEVLAAANIDASAISATVSTGYGRNQVEQRAAAVTEITCHARGIATLLPETEVLIDIGGQDSKVVRLDDRGNVSDFAMNDKCAAGTGRFLEAMSRALEVDLERLAELDRGAAGDVTLSSMCTVFAESEVVSLIARGTSVREIAHALNRAIAGRVASMAKRVARDVAQRRVSMSGGVARNGGVVRALSTALGCEVVVADSPDTVGALGAALIARATRGAPAP